MDGRPNATDLALLEFIARRCSAGHAPTLREMAAALDVASPTSVIPRVHRLLTAELLHKTGEQGASRALHPTADGWALSGVRSTRIATYPEACAELGIEPDAALSDQLAVVGPTGAWLLHADEQGFEWGAVQDGLYALGRAA